MKIFQIMLFVLGFICLCSNSVLLCTAGVIIICGTSYKLIKDQNHERSI